MDKKFWLERWEKSEIGFHLERPHHYLTRFFEELHVTCGDMVFVPLCGKSPDLTWLNQQGAHVIGVELSPIAVADFFAENQILCRIGLSDQLQHYTAHGYDLYCGDLFAMHPALLMRSAAAYDRGALVALPPRMRSAYAAKLGELLPAGCRMLLVSYAYDQREIKGPPFAVPLDEVEELYGELFTVRLLAQVDVLWSHKVLQERGLTSLMELALLLERR